MQMSAQLSYTNVNSDKGWQIPLDSFTLNRQRTTLPAALKSAVIDTGSALTSGPRDVVAAIYAQIPGAERGSSSDTSGVEQWSIPCAADVRISLSFGGKDWAIKPTDMTAGRLEDGKDGTPRCLGGFFGAGKESQNAGEPAWVIGE